MRAVKPGGSQCCFEQFPSPVLCLWDHLWSWSDSGHNLMIRFWPLMLCHYIMSSFLDLQWSCLIKDGLTFVPRPPWVYCLWGQMLSCVEHTDHIWPTAKHFDCHIWSRWEEEEEGQENSGILWSVLLLGLKFSVIWTPPDPWVVWKTPRNPMVVKLFYRNSTTVRNNYDYEM